MGFLTYFLKTFGLAILGVLLCLSLSFLCLVLTFNHTLFNPEFAVSQVEKLNIASLAKDQLSVLILPNVEEFMGEAVNDTITDLEPWMKQQAREVTYSTYDYLEGRSQSWSLVISLEPVQESLRDNLRETLLLSPPPKLAKLSPPQIEGYIDKFYQLIPSTFELDEASISPQVMAQLEQMKQAISYLHTIYYALIGFILLLILGIVLINRKVRSSTRWLGATFLSCGILIYVSILLTKYVIGTQLNQPEIPVYFQTWIPQLLDNTLAPLEIYSLGPLAVGVALLVVSFIYKRGELHAKSLDYSLRPES
jgi:hypothetical protein